MLHVFDEFLFCWDLTSPDHEISPAGICDVSQTMGTSIKNHNQLRSFQEETFSFISFGSSSFSMRISLIVIDAQALCISHSFGVQLHQVELLKEQNPLEQSCLEIFLSKEILEGGMIRIHSAFVHDKFRAKLVSSHRLNLSKWVKALGL
ncbi:hypothetical protein Tco_1335556 [Tanacetum coccineum]